MRFLLGLVPILGMLGQTAQPIPPYVPVPPVRAEPIPTQIPPPPSMARPEPAPSTLLFRDWKSPGAVPAVKVEAKYTAEARAAALEGTVSLYVEVDRDGKPSNVRVMEGLGLGLDEEAVKAVQRWQFEPNTGAADQIQDALEIAIPFRLDPPGPWRAESESYRFTIPGRARYGEIVRPVPVRYVAPDAAACREPGTVTVRLTVGTDGAPHEVRVIEGGGGAAGEAAVNAVEAWRFKPASGNGKKLEAQGQVEFACAPAGDAAKKDEDPPTYRVGGRVSPPVLISKVEPEYSERARKAKLQGTSMLYVRISPEGKATDIHVFHRLGMGLDQKAIEAVKHWRFKPGMRLASPVTVEATIEVNFRLL